MDYKMWGPCEIGCGLLLTITRYLSLYISGQLIIYNAFLSSVSFDFEYKINIALHGIYSYFQS